MKHIVLTTLLAVFTLPLFSQIEFGLKTGIHSYDLSNVGVLTYENNDLDISLTPLEAEYGFQFGLYSRIKLLGLYIEPAVILNSSKFSYMLTTSDTIEDIKNERFLDLDLPAIVGFRFLKFLRIQAGPVGHVTLNSTSDLFDIDGYEETFEGLELGYQAGVGIDIASLRFDMLYESNLKKFGDHISIAGEDISFSDSAARIVFNLGYKF